MSSSKQSGLKRPLASFLPSSSSAQASKASEGAAAMGYPSNKVALNGRPLQDPSSIASTTASLDMMSLSNPAPRQNGLAPMAGREAGSPVAASGATSAAAAHAAPPASLHASAMATTSRGNGVATAACDGAVVASPSTLTKLDPRSVAAHVALPGDEFRSTAMASSSSFALSELIMGKTLGTGTFGRVRLVRKKVVKDGSRGEGKADQYYALKIMTIQEVVRLKQIEHVRSEKHILQKIRHPFIVDLKWTYHDKRFLYMLLEFVVGGELFSYLRAVGRFHNNAASFYAAEIVSALDHLHSNSIIYRDLKPENLLIDAEGHIKITDFGFAKHLSVDNYTWTLCGTPEYLAPEIIQNRGHGKAVDWWALGILIYEMLVGYPPFFDDTPFGIYEKILSGAVEYPRFLDKDGRDIIKRFLTGDKTRRLGSMRGGAEDVKKHKFFKEYDFEKLRERKVKPPFVPSLPSSTADYASNFDDYEEENLSRVSPVTEHELEIFKDF